MSSTYDDKLLALVFRELAAIALTCASDSNPLTFITHLRERAAVLDPTWWQTPPEPKLTTPVPEWTAWGARAPRENQPIVTRYVDGFLYWRPYP